MFQVPMRVWNEIAESQPLSQPWADLFRLAPEALAEALADRVDGPAERAGLDNRTVLALRLVAPLLMECEAISAYLQETEQLDLRGPLPEVTSLNEALILASTEYGLTRPQQRLLKRQLLAMIYRSRQRPARSPAR